MFGGAANTVITETGNVREEANQTDVDFIEDIIVNYFFPIVMEGLVDFSAYFEIAPTPMENPFPNIRMKLTKHKFGKCRTILKSMGASTEYQRRFTEFFIHKLY